MDEFPQPRQSGQSAYIRPHVLIVSDDADLSAFLSEGLTLGGFWTSVIASGLQMLDVFRLRTFDLAIIDATLKGMGATEVLRRLRARTSVTGDHPIDLPVLVVAGSLEEVDPEEVAEAGANGVLLPPLELELLVPALSEVIEAWRREHPGRPWADQVAQARA